MLIRILICIPKTPKPVKPVFFAKIQKEDPSDMKVFLEIHGQDHLL